MPRRFVAVLLAAVLLAPTTVLSTPTTSAQHGSPVAAEPIPTDVVESTTPGEPQGESASESVAPADAGNTPAGSHLNVPVYARADVYLYIGNVVTGGQTDVVDGSGSNPGFAANGFRSDTAKVITITTGAVIDGSMRLCVVFAGEGIESAPSVELFWYDGASWTTITDVGDDTTVCGYTSSLGTFAVAEPGVAQPSVTPATATATSTPTETMTPTQTVPPTASNTPTHTPEQSETATPSPTSTSAPSAIQFALPNVFVTFAQIPTSGDTNGFVLSGGDVPALPSTYLTANAWFFFVESSVNQPGNKQLCVNFETASYADSHRLVLLRSNGSGWSILTGQTLTSLSADQGTHCAYTSSFGDFALVERTPATATTTATPTRTPSPISTATSTRTGTSTATTTLTPSSIASSTPPSTATVTLSPTWIPSTTATPTPTATSTPTATLAPGSYANGTILRTTTKVNVRSSASTTAPTLGAVASGSTVTATGPSVAGGAYLWVPVTSSLGAGWIASNYLVPVATATPTRTPAPATTTSTPGGSTSTRTPTRTPTRPPGGFVAGDGVRTTSNVNLRSAPNTSSTVLRVIPSKSEGMVTGPGVVSGGNTFYPVSISGSTGYLAGSYLQRIGATSTPTRTRTPTATVVGSTVRYTSDNVNMRTGPGTNYGKVATIPKETRVNITGTPRRSGGIDWYPVVVNGVGSGWMAGSFLKLLPPL